MGRVVVLVWTLPLAAIAGIVLTIAVLARRDDAPRAALLVEAVVVAAASFALVGYVASEDHYRGNGISRWDAYDAKGLTAAAVAAGLLAAAAMVVARLRKDYRVAAGSLITASVAATLQFVAFFANSLN